MSTGPDKAFLRIEVIYLLFYTTSCVFFFLFYFNFCLQWILIAVHGFSLVAAGCGATLQLRYVVFSLQWLLLLQSPGSRVCGLSSSVQAKLLLAACGILLDQGSSPCPLHWQADSQSLDHQGSHIFKWLTSQIPLVVQLLSNRKLRGVDAATVP